MFQTTTDDVASMMKLKSGNDLMDKVCRYLNDSTRKKAVPGISQVDDSEELQLSH